jgi:hypothetical protein
MILTFLKLSTETLSRRYRDGVLRLIFSYRDAIETLSRRSIETLSRRVNLWYSIETLSRRSFEVNFFLSRRYRDGARRNIHGTRDIASTITKGLPILGYPNNIIIIHKPYFSIPFFLHFILNYITHRLEINKLCLPCQK